MNREDIDRLARKAGIVDVTSCKWTAHTDDLERFAALVAEQPKQEAEALADRLDDERMNLIERLADDNERLREALKLALNSHGRMLMSDPPQDAWKFNRVDEVINAALRREET